MPENSYSSTITCEVVRVEEDTAPPVPTPAEEPPVQIIVGAEPEVPSCPSLTSSAKRRRRSARRSLQDGPELYGTPEGPSTSKEENQRRFLEKRDLLMDLQIQHMRARLREAEQRAEEARIYKEIAQIELDAVRNQN